MPEEMTRRTFINKSLLTCAGGIVAAPAGGGQPRAGGSPAGSQSKAPANATPTGRIGDLSVSRLVLGGNLLTHYTHSRDLRYVYRLTAHYNTEEKILQTLALAETHGINTMSVHTAKGIVEVLKKHRKRGGKMQWIICPTAAIRPGLEAYRKQLERVLDDGANAIYVWGVHADPLVAAGKVDLIAKAVDMVKDFGFPSGVGAHDLKVLTECEKSNVAADFYIKTFHHHKYPTAPRADELKGPVREIPGYWCSNPREVVEFMKGVDKPWIAFKVMAAGAISPRSAFRHAFDNGADHILAGMFDFEIAEDAAIAKQALAKAKRSRPWRS